MRTVDLIAIHWTGGVGMFAALQDHPIMGGLICALAQIAYSYFSSKK